MKAIDRLLPYLSLFKLRIAALHLIASMVGAIVAGIENFLFSQLVLFALAGGLACAAASVLNNYLDSDIDAIMPRTRKRALVTKKVDPAKVLVLGLGILAISLVLA